MSISELELPSNRNFGLFFAAIFAVVCWYCFNVGAEKTAWVFAFLMIVFTLVALTRSEALLPLNKLWMRFGMLMGMIVNPIVLGAIFFLIFAPIGFLMRVKRRDELQLKMDKSKVTYWKPRQASAPTADMFKNQF